MSNTSHRNLVKEYLKNNNGVITSEYCKAHHIPQVCLSRMVKYHDLFKVCTGVYVSNPKQTDEYFLLQLRNPQLIFSYYTAAHLLTKANPKQNEFWASVPQNYKINKLNKKAKVNCLI